MNNESNKNNQLAHGKIPLLLLRFSVPSIVAMLVSSLYNIVDQFFIGHSIGELGNAATNVTFPLSTLCVGFALMFGIGGASVFSIAMGKAEFDESEVNKAQHYMGNSVTMLFATGCLLFVVTEIFLEPMLIFFGAPANVLEYAKIYTRIIAFGFPFLILSIGGGHLLRADGRPSLTMLCNIIGAVINTVLDALFINGFGWGMAGAAYATVIGQAIGFLLIVYFLAHTKTVKLTKESLIPRAIYTQEIAKVGIAPCIMQLAMMVVQIILNNSLKYYGAKSAYGDTIPLACAGIITKVTTVYMAFIIGISQGLQPIAGYNYGNRGYKRVRSAYFTAALICLVLSVFAFSMFQIFPRQIISVFGNGTPEYYEFAVKYFRIFQFFTFINFMQLLTSNFFTAIGKPRNGMLLSLSRQIILFIPLVLVLPLCFGMDGILIASPIADFIAATICFILIIREFGKAEYQ